MATAKANAVKVNLIQVDASDTPVSEVKKGARISSIPSDSGNMVKVVLEKAVMTMSHINPSIMRAAEECASMDSVTWSCTKLPNI